MPTTCNKIVITGGAGFIGANLIHYLLRETTYQIHNVDKLTYAGNLASLATVAHHRNYRFHQVDIAEEQVVRQLVQQIAPTAILHLAAESHVDRSIDDPRTFIQTNIVGTFHLLHAALAYWQDLAEPAKTRFRFHHVSTDEVFGTLTLDALAFTESSPYDPRSPYAASKASSDHLVRAWHDTYGLPTLITNCSNNYGPYQFPEKLIPVVLLNAIHGSPIPLYGTGENVRDWLYVEDHVRALRTVLEHGTPGETYHIGGDNELPNIQLVRQLCEILDEELPIAKNSRLSEHQRQNLESYGDLIQFVTDRPGHDLRYGMDTTKIKQQLHWTRQEDARSGLRKTVRWYLDNEAWWSLSRSADCPPGRKGLGQPQAPEQTA